MQPLKIRDISKLKPSKEKVNSKIEEAKNFFKLYSKKEILQSFVSGLFLSDGGIKQKTIIYCSISENLVYRLQDVLASFGILSSVYRLKNKKYNRLFFQLNIRSQNIIAFKRIIPNSEIKFSSAGIA